MNCSLIQPILQIWDPSDFFLFANMKKWLGRNRFTSNEMVIVETNAYVEEFEKLCFWKAYKEVVKLLNKVY